MEAILKLVCSWCAMTIREGVEPISHGICMSCRVNIHDERPEDEIADERVLSSMLAAQLKLSLKVIASAQAIAWNDLPANEKRSYMKQAESALRKELAS